MIIKFKALVLTRNNVWPLRLKFAPMNVIPSKTQILGGFGIDSSSTIFLVSIESTFLFHRQTQLFLKRFCVRNLFEGFRKHRREKVTRTES